MTVVKLFETEVVRVGKSDITLNSGGHMGEITLLGMNEALKPYNFKVYVKTGADGGAYWQVSDSKFRLLRFFDGCVLEGAAIPPPQPPPAEAPPPMLQLPPMVQAQMAQLLMAQGVNISALSPAGRGGRGAGRGRGGPARFKPY